MSGRRTSVHKVHLTAEPLGEADSGKWSIDLSRFTSRDVRRAVSATLHKMRGKQLHHWNLADDKLSCTVRIADFSGRQQLVSFIERRMHRVVQLLEKAIANAIQIARTKQRTRQGRRQVHPQIPVSRSSIAAPSLI